jgi:acyl-CoA dehydrogenase
MYGMGTLLRHGNDRQKQQYLPKIATGELRLQAFGVTEPTAGTDTSSIRTTAVRQGDKYVVNGQKVWTSRAEHSDLVLLLARTTSRDEVAKKTDGMSVFLVEMRAALGKGLTIRPIRTMINHATTEVFFDNLEVPAENLIGEEGKGFRYILDGMNAERILIAAECIGDARCSLCRTAELDGHLLIGPRAVAKLRSVLFGKLRHRRLAPFTVLPGHNDEIDVVGPHAAE